MTEEQKQTIAVMRRQGAACTDIATAVGATPTAVRTHCHRYRAEIEATATPGKPNGFCYNCGERIVQASKRKPRKFCCDRCRELWWNQNRHVGKQGLRLNCIYCGKKFYTRRCSGQRYCSHACYINQRFGEVPQP